MTSAHGGGQRQTSASFIHALFEFQADTRPEAIAVHSEQGSLTYRQLDERANRVAHALRAWGVGPESRVGLCTGRCLEMMVGLLGILKAGGAYVPLDPVYPRPRLAFMLEDARISVLLTRRAVEGVLPLDSRRVLRLDEEEGLAEVPSSRPEPLAGPEHLAYVLYTSGSTGRPKGVLVEHRSLLNLAESLGQTFGLGGDSHVLQYASLCFDVSLWEILAAGWAGGTLHLMPPEARLPGPALLALLRERAITHAALPPSVLAVLPDAELPALQVLVSTGEECSASVAARWSPGRRFFNAYGPTEATVHATLFEGTGGARPPPIGRPMRGMSAHVLDDQLRPVAEGAVGELYLGGVGVARGYLHRPELTAERFVPHPETGERLYRTGDSARWLPDGNLDYLGRRDHQVKIRGHRVEPGEVEHVLAQHPAVRAVVVVGREEVPGAPRLVAYLAVRPGSTPGPSGWRRLVREALPEYMVPAVFVELPALPLSPNGKVDRQALPAPGKARPALAVPFRPPLTPLQCTLESVWGQVLGVSPVGLEDDFLELGGDSLRAAAMAARVREVLEVDLSPHELLQGCTLAHLAERTEALRQAPRGVPPLVSAARPERLPLSFAQQRLWFLEQLTPGTAVYNLPFILRLSGPLEVSALKQGLEALVLRHETLRTTFPFEGSEPVQRIAPPAPVPWTVFDGRTLSEGEREARLAERVRTELARPFALGEGPLLRAHLVTWSETEHALLLAIHHAVCDGASMEVLLRDLTALYEAFLHGEPAPLPGLPVQYADYTLWQQQWMRGPVLERGLAFWREQLEGAPRSLDLPADKPRPVTPSFRGAAVAFQIPTETSQALEAFARAEGATPVMALLAGLGILLKRCTGSEEVLVGSPVAGRDRSELEGMIGFFVNTLVLRVQLHGNPSFRELLSRVRERSLAAYAHQDIPFEKLVETLRPDRTGGHQPLFQVMFAPQRPPPEAVARGGLTLRLSEADIQTAPFELTWNVWERDGRWEGTLLYSTELFEADTADRLLRDFKAILEEASRAPELRLSQYERPSRWSASEGASASEMEAALVALPWVEEGAVRLRRSPQSQTLRVAYVVSSSRTPVSPAQLELPPSLTPDGLVALHALPRTSTGQVDEEALRQLPLLDEEISRQWEEQLHRQPDTGEVAVTLLPWQEPASFLHLSDVLPGFQTDVSGSEALSPVEAEEAPRWEPGALALLAFSDGGPLEFPPGAPRTLVEALVRTAVEAPERGITYVGAEGVEQYQRYPELLHEARCVLTGLRASGLGPGARVILQLGSLREHCTSLWACLLGGMTPVTVAIAPAYEPDNAVAVKLHNIWELLGHPPVLTSARLVQALEGVRTRFPMEDVRLLCVEELQGHPPAEALHPAKPEEVAFLQLSSGSTGVPKCIQETHWGLIHHFHAEARVNGYIPDDVSFNWLPFDHVAPTLIYHLGVTYLGHAQVHSSTEWVLGDPLRWLDLMEKHRVSYSWSPNFGFKLVSDAVRQAPHRSWRLDRLKRLMNAGEQVTAPVIREFIQALAPFGLRTQVMQPGYGMAELCTAITYQNDFHPERGVHRVAKSSLNGPLVLKDTEDASTVTFVEVGPPNPGVQLRIVDADHRLLPEGVIGRVQARGAVVTPGYLHNEAANREAFVDGGWFNTGDSGFLLRGRLTLTGREKEMIIVRGSHLYCHEIEDMVRDIDGVEPTYVGACSVDVSALGTEGFAIFFVPQEAELAGWARIATEMRMRVTARLGAAPTFIIPVAREAFPRTTSGKIQRGVLKKALEEGRFAQTLRALDLHQGNANTLPAWFFRRVWRPKAASPRAPAPEGACLLFLKGEGLGTRLREALLQEGRRCITVEPGAAFVRTGPDAFCLRPEDAEAYPRLLAALAEEGVRLAQVLHLWTFGGQTAPPEEAPREGVLSLLLLSQALSRQWADTTPLRLQVVSHHAQSLAPGEEMEADKALMLGLIQTIPQEVPWLDARHVDLPPVPPEQAVGWVLRELETLPRDREVAWRQGKRFVPRLEQVHPTSLGSRKPPFVSGGVYLLSGGLGSLGIELSRRLLKQYQARLLLLGRTPLEAPQAEARLEAWKELGVLAAKHGGEVHYEAVDVCDAEAVGDAVSRAEGRWGRPLEGVLHLAGVLEERVLAEETVEHFLSVLRPKVEGTRALEQLLGPRPEAFFVGFSSVNGVFGGFSVAAYSAANRFLEHFVQARRGVEGSRHFCFSWSRWEGTGLVLSETEERLAHARGYQTLSQSRGWNSLRVALGQPPENLLVGLDARSLPIRVRMDGVPLPAVQLRAFVTGSPAKDTSAGASGPEIRDVLGVRTPVPVLQRLERIPRTASGAVDTGALRALEGGAPRAAQERLALRGEAERKIATIWKEALGVEEVGALDNFFELGGHSLLLSQVRSRLEQDFGRPLPVLELFRYPTVRALAAYLSGQEAHPSGSEQIEERARKQRSAQGRHRLRHTVKGRIEQDE
ncbi:amino acid adenylation domain-containing protein [Stigmatella sp. ncwal1]|uniref:Amino acid adenylation domain-containing protein n=1 Tax=Stigmatella ashevillensis TaxID=2995309 RepID=A0ABT5DGG6_9BACT|nr:non-ribosomal peptide synthetase [Stigmatella ashevillena]MDC0711873.1 amino acid adenylation domain-containing protein [Stigmatella ashevillena]